MKKVMLAFRQLLEDPEEYARMSGVSNPYGYGQAGDRMHRF